jgi:hypothetical protein
MLVKTLIVSSESFKAVHCIGVKKLPDETMKITTRDV